MSLLDHLDEGQLAESLQAHHAARGGAAIAPEAARVCAALLNAAGPDLRWEGAPPDVVQALARESTIPEMRVCRIWLDGADPAGDLPQLIGGDLWGPVRFLAYRALALLGRRNTLAYLLAGLAGDKPMELPEADAILDASCWPAATPKGIASTDGDWGRLLRAEQDPESSEGVLRELAAGARQRRSNSHAERIASSSE